MEEQFRADLMVSSATGFIPAPVAPLVEAVPRAESLAVLRFGFGTAADSNERLSLSDVPLDAMDSLVRIPLLSGSLPGAANEILLQVDLAEAEGVQPGDTFAITTLAGRGEYVVTGIANEQFFATDVIAPTEVFNEIVPVERATITGIAVNAAGDVDDLRADLAEAVKVFPFITVLNGDELGDAAADQVNTIMSVLYALLGLSLVIAVLSIVNTLALSVIERTREIGLTRAVGLGRGQLSGVIMLESVITALFGTVSGMVIGVSLASTLPTIFRDDGLRILDIPWAQLGWMLALTVVVGVLAAVWPAIRAARLPVLQAISTE